MNDFVRCISLYMPTNECTARILQRASGKRYLFATAGLRFDHGLTLPCKLTVSTDSSEQLHPCETAKRMPALLLRASPEMHFRHVHPINPTISESDGNSCPRVSMCLKLYLKDIKIKEKPFLHFFKYQLRRLGNT